MSGGLPAPLTPPFVHLHVHSMYSAMRGVASVEELCELAAQQGFDALALTDTNGVYGIPRFIRAARRHGLTPIAGAELTHGAHRAVALVKNRHGYENLCHLISSLHRDGEFNLISALAVRRAGLVVLSDDEPALTAWRRDARDDLYVEVTPGRGFARAIQLCRDTALPAVATNRVHLQDPEVSGATGPDTAAAYLPDGGGLAALRKAAAGCRGCDLYKRATQTVFGEGDPHAAVVFVGEQPGDYEDRSGHPFVGPAGRVLDEALKETGLDRRGVYITNAVKHFKWEPLGKRRKHKKPVVSEIRACHPWLEAELAAIRPHLVVCLGATAAQAMLGRPVRIASERGKVIDSPSGMPVLVTVHPSAILRAPEPADHEREYARLVKELALVRRLTEELPRTAPRHPGDGRPGPSTHRRVS